MQTMMTPQRNTDVRWEWIGDGWKLFTGNPGAWIGMLLIWIVISLVIFIPSIFFIFIPAGMIGARGDTASVAAAAGVAILLIPLIGIVMLLAFAYLFSGMYRTAIRQARGEAISATDIFSGGDCFLRILGLMFLMVAAQIAILIVFSVMGETMRTLGSLLNSVAGAIINGFLFFSAALIVDQNAGVIEAISKSVEVTKQQWWMYAIFAFVVGLLSSIGALACGIGLLVTMPFYFTVPAVAYRDMFGLRGAQRHEMFPAAPPPPSYQSAPASPNYYAQPPQPQFSEPPQPQLPSSGETLPMGTICPTCGATLTRAANFCNQCGGSLQPR